MLSSILQEHFRKVAGLYSQITPGETVRMENRSTSDIALRDEISSAHLALEEHVSSVSREGIVTRVGSPKPAWAHSYYVSFHDPVNSNGPREGFYPVFLMSVDHRQCWLSLLLPAYSEGITGRGGWSKLRGDRLKERAEILARNLSGYESDGWQKGPITLGPEGSFLHSETGPESTARAYECGAIISKSFDPHNPPDDLTEWLKTAFGFFDVVYKDEINALKALIPSPSNEEGREQRSAAITGAKAEEFFIEWAPVHHPEWGAPVSKTDKVGLGYDILFPDVGIKMEVKGCLEGIQNVRVTEMEWVIAEKEKDKYWLAIVSNLDHPEKQVDLIQDPYRKLKGFASEQVRKQVTYTIPRNALQEYAGEGE